MQRRSTLIVFITGSNRLTLMGCPVTINAPVLSGPLSSPYLDNCKDYLKNPKLKDKEPLPDYMDFKNRQLLDAHLYKDSDIGLILIARNTRSQNDDFIYVLRYTLTPDLQGFEFREEIKVNSHSIVS